MYLTRAEISMASRFGADCARDAQKMHEVVTGLTGSKQSENHVTYRVNANGNRLIVYFYSDKGAVNQLQSVDITGEKDISSWIESLEAGKTFAFDLLAVPSKKVKADGKKNSQRRLLKNPEERIAWLHRKAEQNGFQIVNVTELKEVSKTIRHPAHKGGMMHVNAYQYQGVLIIKNEQLFRECFCHGIGSGKAYGFGMLLLK